MDCIYSVDFSPYNLDIEFARKSVLICSLSIKNILAIAINGCISVLPLEKPNELIPIHEINNICTHLCWSDDGLQLLSIHRDGFCYVFSLKNGLLNQFDQINSFQLFNSEVCVAKWLNKCPKFYFNWDKKDSISFLDKYHAKTYGTLKSFGKYVNNGFLVLDKTGKLHIFLTDLNTVKSNFEKFEFDIQCETFDLGDLTFDQDDNIIVACTKHDIFSSIYVYYINLQINQDGLLQGNCEQKSSFNIQYDSISLKTHLIFCHNDHRNSLCVGLNSQQTNTYCLQFWHHVSTPDLMTQFDFDAPLGSNNNNNGNTTGSANLIGKTGEEYSSNNVTNGTWSFVKTVNCNARLIDIKAPKFPITYNDLVNGNTNYSFYLIASYDNGTVGFIDRVNYNQNYSQTLNTLIEQNQSNYNYNTNKYILKKARVEQYLVTLDQSLTGTIGVGITNTNNLILFRQSNLKEINLNTITYFLNFYEYLMFSGNDYWDLLICTKQKLADVLIERLEERYLKQPLFAIQRAFYLHYYTLLFSLYRQSTNGHVKSLDIFLKLEFNRCVSIITYSIQAVPITVTFDSNLMQQNNSLIDYIDETLKYKHELKIINLIDIAQTILNRKNTQIVANQQLKHLFQWLIDISIYLITLINVINTHKSQPQQQSQLFGVTLLNDLQFINEIRKCLIYVKILFLYASSTQQTSSSSSTNNNQFQLNVYASLPVLPVRSSSNKDLINDLFNIYTKIFIKLNENLKLYSDDLLMDQCINLEAETIIRPVDELFSQIKYPWLGVNLSMKPCLQLTIDQYFNDEKSKREYPLFDVIRFIYFSRSQTTKQCIRCGSYSETITASNNTSSTTTTAAGSSNNENNIKNNSIYILDSSADKCICGGLWVLSSLS